MIRKSIISDTVSVSLHHWLLSAEMEMIRKEKEGRRREGDDVLDVVRGGITHERVRNEGDAMNWIDWLEGKGRRHFRSVDGKQKKEDMGTSIYSIAFIPANLDVMKHCNQSHNGRETYGKEQIFVPENNRMKRNLLITSTHINKPKNTQNC